jgi:hypothetical protein
MQIYLQHSVHGRKIASMEAEAEHDEQHGWVRYNPDTPSEPEEAANTLVVKRKYTRKAETEGV